MRVQAHSHLSQAHSMGSCDVMGWDGMGRAGRARLRVDDERGRDGGRECLMRAALCNIIPPPLRGGCILSNVLFFFYKTNYITLS